MAFVRSPLIAAFFSFLAPGLGQFALGAVRRGLLVAVPAVTVLIALIGLRLGRGGDALDLVIRPEDLIGLLILNVVLAAYHLLAITDAYGLAARVRPIRAGARRASALILAVLLVGTVGLHGAVEAVGYQAYTTFDRVFVPSGPNDEWAIPEPSFKPEPSDTPSPSLSPSPSASPTLMPSSTPSASPTAAPSPSPSVAPPRWAANGRLDLLLIGSDAGPDRWSLRTDTLVVLSIDVTTGRMALFGVPRNMVGVPLPPESAGAFRNGRFPGLLNALYVYAMGHPGAFPGGDARGFRAVTGAVQELVGVRLDGAVVVNLAGFVELIDALGGLWIDVPERLVDPNYPLEDGSGQIRFDIRPGCRHLDGRMALAYARSRHQDSDYGRMRRQQAVLVALGRQIDPLKLLPRVPRLLDIAGRNLWTTVRRADVKGLAQLGARADSDRVTTVLFVPSRYPSHLDSAEIARIRHVVRSVFDGPAPSAPAHTAGGASCP